MVCVVGDVLIDASSRQMHRPDVGIVVNDCVTMDTNRDFMENSGYAIGSTEQGTVLCYQISEADYRQVGFMRSSHNLAAADRIVQKMKQLLEERSRAKSSEVGARH